MNIADYNQIAAQEAWDAMNNIDYHALPKITNLNQIGPIPKEFDDYGIKDALQIINTQTAEIDYSEVSLFKNIYGIYLIDDSNKIIYAQPRVRVTDNLDAVHIARVRTINRSILDYVDYETWYRTTLNYFVKSLNEYNERLAKIGDYVDPIDDDEDNEAHDCMFEYDHPVIKHNFKILSIKNPKKLAANHKYIVDAATKVYNTKGLPTLEEHFRAFNKVLASDGFDAAYNFGDYNTIYNSIVNLLGLSDDQQLQQQGISLLADKVYLTLPEPKYTIARRTKQAIQRNINLLAYELVCSHDLNLEGV